MQTISCPQCGKSLPESAGYCTGCGKVAPLAEVTLRLPPASSKRAHALSRSADSEEPPREANEADITVKLAQKARTWAELAPEPLDDMEEEEILEPEPHATWQKVVSATPHALPAYKKSRRFFGQPQTASRPFIWLGSILLFALILSSMFVAAIRFGHAAPPPAPLPPTFHISPSTIALGGIITLRGAHFAPHSTLTLSRDQGLPLIDTGGVSSLQADAQGTFSDTVIIDPDWLPGSHTLYATDAHTRQRAAFSLSVTGQSALQGPPHLLLSATSLNFGAGDEATNGNQLLAISNAGGGQLVWQASSEQSWLQMSPTSGSIASGTHMPIIVAIDRSKLHIGNYTTNVTFTSNTEQASLIVSMSVIPLQPEHQAALQLSPAVLTFNATANGPNPLGQVVTVNNPGVQPLSWGLTTALQNGNDHWLLASSQAGTIAPSGQQQIIISVRSQGLAPGVYKGTLTFSNRGLEPVQGSPQSIFVNLTVAPLCTLTFTPSNLSFTGMHGQASPGAQTLQIGVAQGCTASQTWNATSATVNGGNWLSLSQNSGRTPAQVQVNVSTAGLAPGRYTGTLTFTARAGQQIVPVTLTVTPVACALTALATLSLQGSAGQATPLSQNATLGSNGDCPNALNWTSSAVVLTPSGGSWLSAASSGTFTPPAGASLAIQADLAGLSAGTYNGIVNVSAVDSVTSLSVGIVQIAVTLTVLPPCTLQTPSTTLLTLTANVGSNPTPNTASFTISATGNCAGSVTITPAVGASGNGWLTITGPATLASGGTATFTVTITSTALAAGIYTSAITLNASDDNGPLAGSPQTITVSLTVS